MEENPKTNLTQSFVYPLFFIELLWVIKFIEWKFDINFAEWGVFPRATSGLRGIITAPLVHADFLHLLSNTFPMLILGVMMMYFYRTIAFRVFGIIYIFSNVGTWLFARENYHIGASGLIYGLAGFLFFSGVIRRDVRLLALSLLVTFLYGGLVWGFLPLPDGVSYETHLSGAIVGSICAIIFRKHGPQRKVYEWENEEEEDTNDESLRIYG